MDQLTLSLAIEYAKKFRCNTIDIEKHIITIPFSPSVNESAIPVLMSGIGIGKWYADNGFNISFETRDVEYMTKPIFETRSMTSYKGHKAYLRNRLVATITW